MAILIKEEGGRSTCILKADVNRVAFQLVQKALGQSPSTLLFLGVSNGEIVNRCQSSGVLGRADLLILSAALSSKLVVSNKSECEELRSTIESLNLSDSFLLDICPKSTYPIHLNECEVTSISNDEG